MFGERARTAGVFFHEAMESVIGRAPGMAGR